MLAKEDGATYHNVNCAILIALFLIMYTENIAIA